MSQLNVELVTHIHSIPLLCCCCVYLHCIFICLYYIRICFFFFFSIAPHFPPINTHSAFCYWSSLPQEETTAQAKMFIWDWFTGVLGYLGKCLGQMEFDIATWAIFLTVCQQNRNSKSNTNSNNNNINRSRQQKQMKSFSCVFVCVCELVKLLIRNLCRFC